MTEIIIPSASIVTAIQERYSCRIYDERPLSTGDRQQVQEYLAALRAGPLGTRMRFILTAATAQQRDSLRGLGTYGFIQGATAFIIGAAGPGEKNLEDYGYTLEQAILFATALDIGTCWLGGSFTQSSFARKIARQPAEIVPAVVAAGYPAVDARARDRIRRQAHADCRLPWETLFFRGAFGSPLSAAMAGAYAVPLEMLRLAPSASNKQPWRVVQQGHDYHFYLQRTPRYGQGSLTYKLLRLADLQRVDMGIAMCHFELTAREAGLQGRWVLVDPGLPLPGELTHYTVTWAAQPAS
jgi:nitroreductase